MSPQREYAEVTMLQALRMDRGLTISDVEKASGVSFKTISAYERGLKPSPRSVPLEKLARFYKVRASDLLEDLRRFIRERDELSDAA